MDVVERGWAAQEAAVAAYDEASTAAWNADWDEYYDRPPSRPSRSRPLPPVCAYGCPDPWHVDPACDVCAYPPKTRKGETA